MIYNFLSLGQNCIPAHFSASLSRARALRLARRMREQRENVCVCVSSRPVCTISFIFAGRPTSKKIVRVRKLLNLCDFFFCCSAFNFAAKTNHGIFFEQCSVSVSRYFFLFSFFAIFFVCPLNVVL